MTEKNQTHIATDKQTKRILQRVALIKRWGLTEFLRFISELFIAGMDMLDNEDIDISVLRELYQNWQLAVYPYGYERGDKK